MNHPESRESIYDREIGPLVAKIVSLCQKHDIPVLASFDLRDDRRVNGTFYTTAIIPVDGSFSMKVAADAILGPLRWGAPPN